MAARRALVTDFAIASLARGRLVILHAIATVLAVSAIPTIERNVGAVITIGLQHLPHEQEEVQNPSLLQSLTDGRMPISFAEPLGLDMRMRDAGVGRGRVGIQSDDLVARALFPRHHDLEPAQFNPVQDNEVCGHRQSSFLQIVMNFLKLLVERGQVLKDLVHTGDRDGTGSRMNLMPAVLQLPDKAGD